MFSTRIAVSADLTAKTVTLTLNGKETATAGLIDLDRIDAIGIV